MLLAIAGLVLTLTQFGNDSIEIDLIALQENVCIFFEESQEVAEATVEANEPVDSELGEAAADVIDVVEVKETVELVKVDLRPEAETEVIETTTSAPETSVIEEEVVDAVAVEAEEPVVVVADESAEQVAAQWSQLSEEARESILLLIEIDLNTQE